MHSTNTTQDRLVRNIKYKLNCFFTRTLHRTAFSVAQAQQLGNRNNIKSEKF